MYNYISNFESQVAPISKYIGLLRRNEEYVGENRVNILTYIPHVAELEKCGHSYFKSFDYSRSVAVL